MGSISEILAALASISMRKFLSVVVLSMSACSQAAATAAPATPTPQPTQAASPTPGSTTTPSPAIVGKWSLEKVCARLVEAMTEAGVADLIPETISELVSGPAPSGADPCANALPLVKHSHTFWPDGRFNSYDQNEREVDTGRWILVDADTIKIGDPVPDAEFTFSVRGDALELTPVVPADCRQTACLDGLGWRFAVAMPGETWTRQTSGGHVP